MDMAEAGMLRTLSVAEREAIANGEVLEGMLHRTLPAEVRATYAAYLAPSKVLSAYNAIFGATEFGYIWVPKEEYDAAWRLVSITAYSTRYALRREYVVRRINRAASFSRAA